MLVKDFLAQASPLTQQQTDQLQALVGELSTDKLAWISGYFWGLSQSIAPLTAGVQSVQEKEPQKLSILYGSQTGNAKALAKDLEIQAKEMGFNVSLCCAQEYKPRNLVKETHLILITSTHGEGEAPDNAISLHQFLQSKKASKLDKLHYAVLGLGDSSYEFFCQTAKDFDCAFKKLGAKAIAARFDCDVDYELQAQKWCDELLTTLKGSWPFEGNPNNESVVNAIQAKEIKAQASQYNKKKPYPALLTENQKITGRDSGKAVYHLEIALGESGLTYQPGDALGVFYTNNSDLVEEILACAGLNGDENVEVSGASISLRRALSEKYCITASNIQQVTDFAKFSQSKTLLKYLEDKEQLRHYVNNTHFVDVLKEKKTDLSPTQLTSLLRKIKPRFYSIASSQKEVEEEVHLTVGLLAFDYGQNKRFGGASGFLCRGLCEGETVHVFVEPNLNFKLPDDDNAPIIMVGPGTGVAPFRSFMQEREARGAKGKNWLIFGERTFTQDFLYQMEWQAYLKDGLLTKIDLAFSRDQAEKIYVQHKIFEHRQEIWEWLQEGAYLYVCGDGANMAKDVHEAFSRIIELQGEDPNIFLSNLREAKRYQKDVY